MIVLQLYSFSPHTYGSTASSSNTLKIAMWTLAVKVFTLRRVDQLDSSTGGTEPHSSLNTRLASNTGERISGALVSTISRSVKRSSSQNLEVDVSRSYACALVATFSRAGQGSLRVKYVGCLCPLKWH